MQVKVGKIKHYYNKIGVAVVEMSGSLSIGDNIKIVGHDIEATQEVASMQIEGKPINKTTKGQSIGLKVDQLVRENDEVYLVKS